MARRSARSPVFGWSDVTGYRLPPADEAMKPPSKVRFLKDAVLDTGRVLAEIATFLL